MKKFLTVYLLALVVQVSANDFFPILEKSFSEQNSDEINCAESDVIYRIYFSQDWDLLGTSEMAFIYLKIQFPESVGDLKQYPTIGLGDHPKVDLVLKRKTDGILEAIESSIEEDIVSEFILTIGRNELFSMDTKRGFENYSQFTGGNMIFAERIRGTEVRRTVRKSEESIPAENIWRYLNQILSRHLISNRVARGINSPRSHTTGHTGP